MVLAFAVIVSLIATALVAIALIHGIDIIQSGQTLGRHDPLTGSGDRNIAIEDERLILPCERYPDATPLPPYRGLAETA